MHGKEFKDINVNELIELVNLYVGENRYPHYYDPKVKPTINNVLKWFESKYYPVYVLKEFFRDKFN